MSKELVLIRHTKSSWKELGMRDFDRPLKKDRISDADVVFKELNRLKLSPDKILCSPAVRTKQTAEIFCTQTGYNFNSIEFDMRLYESSAEEYLEVIHEQEKVVNTLVVFGHNPSVTILAGLFVQNAIYNLPTTGVVWLSFESEDWKISRNTPSLLKHFITPKALQL
jgi:phosphohistidine phosphatase